MKTAQSPREMPPSHAVPMAGRLPRLRDSVWLPRYTAVGLWYLTRSAFAFRHFAAKDIPIRNREAQTGQNAAGSDHLARIAYVLPRLSKRLPWRSDCLIQAMAAQDWLGASNIPSDLQIGVEKPEDGAFAAHAWLVYDGTIVTGGDISRYETILASPK